MFQSAYALICPLIAIVAVTGESSNFLQANEKRVAQELFWDNRGKKSVGLLNPINSPEEPTARSKAYYVPNKMFGLYFPKRSNVLTLQLRPNGNLLPMGRFDRGKKSKELMIARPNSHLFGPMFSNQGKRGEDQYDLDTFFAGRGRKSYDDSLDNEMDIETDDEMDSNNLDNNFKAFFAGRGKKYHQHRHEDQEEGNKLKNNNQMAFYAGRGKREAPNNRNNNNNNNRNNHDESHVFFALRG